MRRAAVCVALVLLTAAVFAGTSANGFINYDDPEYVVKNDVVGRGMTWQGFVWAITATQESNWHPLTWWSHMLDVSLFGARPGPHHLVSVLLHALSALLLFLALDGLTGTWWPSATVAALFAAHPLQVESVAWISQRKGVLCGLFLIFGLLAYTRYARRPGAARYVAVTAAFAFALMAKPAAVVFPLWLLLLDWWPLGRLARGTPGLGALLKEKAPLFVLSLAAGLLTLYAQWQGGAVKSLVTYPVAVRLENALRAVALYPLNYLWPLDLGVFYPHPGASIPWWQLLGAGLLAAAVAAHAAAGWMARPWLAVGWGWYLVSLLPVVGVVQVGEQSMADRYAYLPSIGLGIALAWWMAAAARRSGFARAALPAAAAAIVILAASARVQVGFWSDSETLFRHSLKVAGESTLIRTNLGGALSDEGRWQDALQEYDLALRGNPGDLVAWFNAGVAWGKLGRWAEAEEAFRKLVEMEPGDLEARHNLRVIAARRGNAAAAGESLPHPSGSP